jgi:hypothetical protein
LARAFHGVLSWKWDRRFETVLAEFGVETKDNVRATLERFLGNLWDSSNVGNAPSGVRAIDNRLGGLWPGQLLFTTDTQQDNLVFCCWWPWGDGKSISIRVGLCNEKLTDSEWAELVTTFKTWFSV